MSSRILVVEPDVFVREAIVAALEHHVWVVGVGTAREALDQLRSESFDVVLAEADLGRGEPSGHRLFGEIGRRWPWVRRILMSDSHDRDSAEPFLLKPLGAQQLAVIAGLEEELSAA
jgi:DNA-binding NtrC family response regulator